MLKSYPPVQLWTAVVFLLASLAQGSAQNLNFQAIRLTNGAAELILSGAGVNYHRVEISTNLGQTHWVPIGILSNTNDTKRLSDADVAGVAAKFYRAVQVDPVLRILRFLPESGPPDTRITLEGQFFTEGETNENVVAFAGAQGRVLEATPTRLVAEVPTNARSGRITVIAKSGTVTSDRPFTVLNYRPLQFAPPNGIAAGAFELVSDGGFALSTGAPGGFTIAVPRDAATIVVAAPTNEASPLFFYGVMLPDDVSVTIDAQSTARALVFQSPFFLTTDPTLAGKLMAVIAQDVKVQALGQLIGQLFPQAGDPGTNETFIAAYAAAVASVGNSTAMQSVAAQVTANRALGPTKAAFDSSTYPLEWYQTRFLEVNGADRKYKVEGAPFNPVDWIAVVQEIDVDRAFPDGRLDFDKIHQQNFPPVEFYPLLDNYYQEASVDADHFFSRFDYVAYLSKQFVDWVKGEAEGFTLPPHDGIYVVRGIGPAFLPAEDYNFVTTHYREIYARVVAINLVNGVLDLSSAAIEGGALEELGDWREFKVKLVNEAIKAVPTIQSPEDFMGAVVDLMGFFLSEAIDAATEHGLKSGGKALMQKFRGQKRAINLTRKGLGRVLDNETLKVTGALGQVAERASGLVRTTSLETSFIVVGDPFQLYLDSITPSAAAPGSELTLVVRSGRHANHFDRNNPKDQVNFEGPTYFDGLVTSVSAPDSNGVQVLQVRLPADLPASADGTYTVYVNSQGRRGSISFQLTVRPFITDMSPREGFAAAPDFVGAPYPGTVVRLKGGNFSPTDQFFFSQGTAGIEATNKSGSTGNVVLNVPAGAASGPITIRKNYSGEIYEVRSPAFRVIGAPMIYTMDPTSGTIGSYVSLVATNIGSDLANLRVQFPGTVPQTPGLRGGLVTLGVPTGATNGYVILHTPAGQALSPEPFLVTTGLTAGATLTLSVSSVITLERAAIIAASDGLDTNTLPQDDLDFITNADQTITALDSNGAVEEGDFITPDYRLEKVPRWPVGAVYADFISIQTTNPASATFTGSYDTISGGILRGTIGLAGNHILVTSSTIIEGQMIITGDHNNLNLTKFRYCPGTALIIRGNYNKISITCETNGGDGVRIEGGKFNDVTINRAKGNLGNGITLTGGASFNHVRITTGTYNSTLKRGDPDSGNAGHGVALIGDAQFNEIESLSPGILSNQGDGLYLDGAGVISNNFTVLATYDNRGNGITVTNGAVGNRFGTVNLDGVSSAITSSRNGKSGLALYCPNTQAALITEENAACGALLANVTETNGDTKILLSTARLNQQAGVRLEGVTRGIVLMNSSTMRSNTVGLEMIGPEVQANYVELSMSDSLSNGVYLVGASSNRFALNVQTSRGHGILARDAHQNDFKIKDVSYNQGDGMILSEGSSGNWLRPFFFVAPFYSNSNGLALLSGANNNLISQFQASHSRGHGLLLSGAGTAFNRFVRPSALDGDNDGIRIENGAATNTLGDPQSFLGPAPQGNAKAGVRVTGSGSDGNQIIGAFISSGARTQAVGVVVENGAADTLLQNCTMYQNRTGIAVHDQARGTTLKNNFISQNFERGILISNAVETFVGGPLPAELNQITFNPLGLELYGTACASNLVRNNQFLNNTNAILFQSGAHHNQFGPGNLVQANGAGLQLDGAHTNWIGRNSIVDQIQAGLLINNAAHDNFIGDNVIQRNATGVAVDGSGTARNRIRHNDISRNTGKGIALSAGGNTDIPAPRLIDFDGETLLGLSATPDGTQVEVYRDPAEEGEVFMAAGTVADGHFKISLKLNPDEVGTLYRLNATVTDPLGNTSEFSDGLDTGDSSHKTVFVSSRDGNPELYLNDGANAAPNSAAIRLTANAANDSAPMLSCDASGILFVSNRDGNDDIYLMPAVPNATATRLTTHPARDYDPCWTSDCQRILFVSERDGPPGLYLMNADGSGQTRISDLAVSDINPSISPDGTKIAFASNRGGTYDIYLMTLGTTNAQLLAGGSGHDVQPRWSADGTTIAFVSDRDGNQEIYTVRPDGTQLTRLTTSPAADINPVFLPGGKQVMFSSNRDGGYELYLCNRATKEVRRLTVSAGDNQQPHIR